VDTRLPSNSPVETAFDRRASFYKKIAWAGLLLAGSLYIVGIFGPLELFSPSVRPSVMRDVSARTLVCGTDVTRAIRERAQIDAGSGPKLPGIATELDAFAFARIC
jgi:hypothetical protein